LSNKIYSIGRQLTLVVILGVALVLAASSVLLNIVTGTEMKKFFDYALLDKARALETLTEIDKGKIDLEFVDKIMPEFEDKKDPQYFELWVDGNTVIERSGSLNDHDLPQTGLQLGEHRFGDLVLPDGRLGRLVEITFVPQVEDDNENDQWMTGNSRIAFPAVTLVVARERVSLDRQIMTNRVTITATMSVVLVLIAILVSKYVKDGFSPVNRLAYQVQNINENQLGTRITHQGPQSIELAPIEQQINHLLDRLEKAFARERQFSSDVAHELRTPVAELKSLAEVGGMRPEDQDTVLAFFNDVKIIVRQMEKIVTSLLTLARLDAERGRINTVRFLLSDLVDSTLHRIPEVPKNNKFFENSVPRDLAIHTDKDNLEIILKNLLLNAIAYSPKGAIIRISTERYEQGVRLFVSNPATDLDTADIPHMKERFWRKDQARSNSQHSGLGLSLVDGLAAAMGLEMKLELNSNGEFTVYLFTLSTSPLN